MIIENNPARLQMQDTDNDVATFHVYDIESEGSRYLEVNGQWVHLSREEVHVLIDWLAEQYGRAVSDDEWDELRREVRAS